MAKKKLNTKKMCLLAVSVSLAMILSFIESQIPPLTAVPGVKIGLANIVSLFLLFSLGAPSAFAVSLIRVVLSSMLFGSAVSLFYSLSGAVASLLIMIIFKKLHLFSMVGVSVIGGVFHNIAQVFAAMIVMGSAAVVVYLPPLLVSGVIAGIAVGTLAGIVLVKLKNHKVFDFMEKENKKSKKRISDKEQM